MTERTQGEQIIEMDGPYSGRSPRLGEGLRSDALVIVCMSCWTSKKMPLERALMLWGRRTKLEQIAKDVMCPHCKRRDRVNVTFHSPAT